MAKSLISVGSTPNDGLGDTLRDAGLKINSNFNEIYGLFGNGSQLTPIWAIGFSGIHTSSNVGIASTTPQYPLDVNGTVRASSFIGDGSQLTGITDLTGPWTQNQSGIYTSSNVGIGSTIPDYKLDVNGTVRATSFIGDGSGLTQTGYWAKNISGINTNNYVGIGTTIPNYDLDVNGTVRATNFIGNGSGLTQVGYWEKTSSGINTGAYVGIGTTVPNYDLDVNGIVKANSFIGDGSSLTGIGPWGENIVGIFTSSYVGIGTTSPNYSLDVEGGLEINLPTSSPPTGPRDMTFEFIDNTTLRIKVKGTDNVIRAVDLTLTP